MTTFHGWQASRQGRGARLLALLDTAEYWQWQLANRVERKPPKFRKWQRIMVEHPVRGRREVRIKEVWSDIPGKIHYLTDDGGSYPEYVLELWNKELAMENEQQKYKAQDWVRLKDNPEAFGQITTIADDGTLQVKRRRFKTEIYVYWRAEMVESFNPEEDIQPVNPDEHITTLTQDFVIETAAEGVDTQAPAKDALPEVKTIEPPRPAKPEPSIQFIAFDPRSHEAKDKAHEITALKDKGWRVTHTDLGYGNESFLMVVTLEKSNILSADAKIFRDDLNAISEIESVPVGRYNLRPAANE